MASSPRNASEAVTVAVRVRPRIEGSMNAAHNEERFHPEACSRLNDNTIRLSETKRDATNTTVARTQLTKVDAVFGPESTQEEVYEDTTFNAVDAALQGSSATIITYGQTGSGKTFTVLGAMETNPLAGDEVVVPDTGLFLRVVRDVLQFRDRRKDVAHVTVGISVVEIYLDTVRDLLGDKPTASLKVQADNDNVRIGETVRPVRTLRDAATVYREANARRVSRSTDFNDTSSRSHALLTIELFQQERTPGNPTPLALADIVTMREKQPPKAKGRSTQIEAGPGQPPLLYSKIVLADLAGSEKMKNVNAKGEALEEMKKINTSLTKLGNVVHALFKRSSHIPYRDSRLTLLLRAGFASPNSRIVLIANVAPTTLTYDETRSTLIFADKVKGIQPTDVADSADYMAEANFLAARKAGEELFAEMRVFSVATTCLENLRGVAGTTPVQGRTEAARKARVAAITERLQKLRSTGTLLTGAEREAEEWKREAFDSTVGEYHRTKARVDDELDGARAEVAAKRSAYAEEEKERKQSRAVVDADAAVAHKAFAAEDTQKRALLGETAKIKQQEAAIKAQQKALEVKLAASLKDQKKAWDADDRKAKADDRTHALAERTFTAFDGYRESRLGCLAATREMYEVLAEGEALRLNGNRYEAQQWLRTVVVRIARNAATLGARRSHSERPDAPKAEHRDPNAAEGTAARAKPEPERPRSTQTDATLFDQASLIGDILSYMRVGSSLLKHGRRGQPHYRFFFLETINGPDGQEHRVCWNEQPKDKTIPPRGFVDMHLVESVTLGQSSTVFDRNASKDGVHLSFSMHYRLERDARTLDVVCDSTAEMEAWVIGLCHLSGRNPHYGAPMDLPADSPQLSEEDTELCTRWHVRPRLITGVRNRVAGIKAQRKLEALRMTPGQMRYLCDTDIFRANALWEHLIDTGDIAPSTRTVYQYLKYDTEPA